MMVAISRWILLGRCSLSSWIRSKSKLKFWLIRSFLYSFNLLSKSFHEIVLSWKFELRAKKWVYTNISASLWGFDNVNNLTKTKFNKDTCWLVILIFGSFYSLFSLFFVWLIDPKNVWPILGCFWQQKSPKKSDFDQEQPSIFKSSMVRVFNKSSFHNLSVYSS